jgi:hypothetical protein
LFQLVQKARAGNASVLPRLRKVLKKHPEIWQRAGDVTRMVERSWIGLLTCHDPLYVESVLLQAAAMKKELEGPEPTALERLLVAQIVACWLESEYAQILLGTGDGELSRDRHRVRHADVAHRKYLAALKALATVRALRPAMTVPTTPLKICDIDRQQA